MHIFSKYQVLVLSAIVPEEKENELAFFWSYFLFSSHYLHFIIFFSNSNNK